MKKLFASLLALAMVLGMAPLALANDHTTDFGFYPFQFGGPAGAPTVVSTDPKDSVDIQIWSDKNWEFVDEADKKYTQEEFFRETWERFAASYPGAKINSISTLTYPGSERDEKLAVAMRNGKLPDLLFGSFFSMSSKVYQGLFLPLDDIVTEDIKRDIDPSVWELAGVNGQIYCYPWSQGLGFLGYNADMFRQAGLDKYIGEEKGFAVWTPEDYLTILRTLKEKLPATVLPSQLWCNGTNGDTWNVLWLRMFGAQWFDETGKVVLNEDERAVKALEMLKQIYDEGLSNQDPVNLKSSEAKANLANQLAAIGPEQQASMPALLGKMESGKVTPFDIRLAYMPGQDAPQSFSYVYGFMAVDTQKETNIKVVKDYLTWLNRDENLIKEAVRMGYVRNSMMQSDLDVSPYKAAYGEAIKHAVNFSNNTIAYTELRSALYPELQAVFAGDKTPKEALDAYAQKANEIIAEAQKDSIFQ